MLAKNTTMNDLYKAMRAINKKYDDNITWNRVPEYYSKQIRFTLKVKSSKGLGAKLSYGGCDKPRRTVAACWHVHGDFFDILLGICASAEITTNTNRSVTKVYVDNDGDVIGNWHDWSIGSMMFPVMFSESCECDL